MFSCIQHGKTKHALDVKTLVKLVADDRTIDGPPTDDSERLLCIYSKPKDLYAFPLCDAMTERNREKKRELNLPLHTHNPRASREER